jgi:hypothetical protein
MERRRLYLLEERRLIAVGSSSGWLCSMMCERILV